MHSAFACTRASASRTAAVGIAASCTTPKLASRKTSGAAFRTSYVQVSAGSTSMARWLPSPNGISRSCAAPASAQLIAAAASVPPVIPVTTSGAAMRRPRRRVDRSISSTASSGRALWIR